MAQSDSEISDNVMQESVSDVEAELNALTPNAQNQFDDFELGATVCAVSNPTVEGLIVGKVETSSGNIEVVLLVPGYKKKGHAPIFASIVRKELEKLSKRQVRKYAFPMPNLEKWQSCVRKHKKDFSWTTAAIQVLNAADKNYLAAHNIQSSPRGSARKSLHAENFHKDAVVGTTTVQQPEEPTRKRNSQNTDKSKASEALSLYEDSDMSDVYDSLEDKTSDRKKKAKLRKVKSVIQVPKKAKKTKRSSDSLSDSSSASSKSTNTDTTSSKSSTVSNRTKCPFSFRDSRGNRHVKARMKGKAEERKYIRSALHNLYSSYSSMKCVVNDIRARTLATGGRPLTFDLIWLEQHAIYLDTLMFESFRGVWKQWNEPVVDELSLAFLELLVRVSPRREYSDRLDEKVRKWMKKKRIGVSQRYGPVPAYLQQAKITEAGIFANNFAQRRWSSTQAEKTPFNGSAYRPNFRQFQAGVAKQNGGQPVKQKNANQRKSINRRLAQEIPLNEKIHALNLLWCGPKFKKQQYSFVHWSCVASEFKSIYLHLIRLQAKASTLPMCGAAFQLITKAAVTMYSDDSTTNILLLHDQVKPALIALPCVGFTIVPILQLLPLRLQAEYLTPASVTTDEIIAAARAATFVPSFKMRRSEYINILIMLYERNMITWFKADKVISINGLQCVTKALSKQRLIFDGRRANCYFKEPEKVELPSFQLLQSITHIAGSDWLFAKIDIDNFYHRLCVPQWMLPYLGLPPVTTDEKEKHFPFSDQAQLVPVCTTLPMGLSHAVLLAQEAHLNILNSLQLPIQWNEPVKPKQNIWGMVYIDDVIIACRNESAIQAEQYLNEIVQFIVQRYECVGLKVKEHKVVWASHRLTGLGCIIDGKIGAVAPIERKFARLIQATKFMLSLSKVQPKNVEIILGHWVWFLLLKRPLFSVLFDTYKWLSLNSEQYVAPIWNSVKEEFRVLLFLADTIELNWRRSNNGLIIASDASLLGAGACYTIANVTEHGEMSSQDYSLIRQQKWTAIVNKKWIFQEHINVLEARAFIMAVRHFLSDTKVHRTYINVCTDSEVVKGIFRKGRTSSFLIAKHAKRLAALQIAMDLFIYISWIPTNINPADVLSRCFAGEEARSQNEDSNGD